MANNLRITGGIYTNKKLGVPVASGTRPAQAIVREVLFNWIGNDLTGKTCLDLFAGTGMLSWEAMSRGAAKSILIEQHSYTCRCLKEQSSEFGYTKDNLLVLRRDVYRWLNRNHKEDFDIIFIDPPYETDYFKKCVPLLLAKNLLKTGGYIFYEVSAKEYEEIPWLQESIVIPRPLRYSTEQGDQKEYKVIKNNNRGNTYFGLIGGS